MHNKNKGTRQNINTQQAQHTADKHILCCFAKETKDERPADISFRRGTRRAADKHRGRGLF